MVAVMIDFGRKAAFFSLIRPKAAIAKCALHPALARVACRSFFGI
jgi:hypothetical protein